MYPWFLQTLTLSRQGKVVKYLVVHFDQNLKWDTPNQRNSNTLRIISRFKYLIIIQIHNNNNLKMIYYAVVENRI